MDSITISIDTDRIKSTMSSPFTTPSHGHNSDTHDHASQSAHFSKTRTTSRRRNNSNTPSTNTMATVRRLSDGDVRSIFECLHHNRPPPAHLKFSIVPVGSNGLSLSPPSYEFEDGLYVLLKPVKKNASFPDYSTVPSHLMGHIIKELPPEKCPWSLSGPQFPMPTAIQQRYCYPKGNQDYSSQKGGALWTMVSVLL